MATTLKARIRTMLPAALANGAGIAITKLGLIYTIAMDWSQISPLVTYDPSAQQLLARSTVDGSFGLVTITQVLTASQTSQTKTGAGDVNVATTDGLITVNKTVGGATTVNLPLASSKVGDVLIVDFKGDADTNNITIVPSGLETFNGAITSWKIASQNGAVVCKPISGVGYAIK